MKRGSRARFAVAFSSDVRRSARERATLSNLVAPLESELTLLPRNAETRKHRARLRDVTVPGLTHRTIRACDIMEDAITTLNALNVVFLFVIFVNFRFVTYKLGSFKSKLSNS